MLAYAGGEAGDPFPSDVLNINLNRDPTQEQTMYFVQDEEHKKQPLLSAGFQAEQAWYVWP